MPRTIVITGTATGLGQAAVKEFAERGWNVVATVRKESDLGVHARWPQVRTLVLDVDDEQAAEPFARSAVEQFGRVDVLVNNAGYYQMGPLEASSSEQIHRQFQTNVFGLIAVTKAFVPAMREQHAGTIINIASLTAEQGYPYSSVYAASKAAVATLSEALNIELAEFGITVKAVLPGQHATRIFTKIDAAQDVPEPYQEGIKAFFAKNTPTGSEPAVTARVIHDAAVDTRTEQVRYYSGPDAVAIPRAKRVLGPDGYWEEFRNSITNTPSPLFASLVPAPGDTPVDWRL